MLSTGWRGLCGNFEQFSGVEFFLVLSIVHACPAASSADWVTVYQELATDVVFEYDFDIHLVMDPKNWKQS